MFGILQYIIVKKDMDDSVTTCDDDIQSYDKEIKIIFIIICT